MALVDQWQQDRLERQQQRESQRQAVKVLLDLFATERYERFQELEQQFLEYRQQRQKNGDRNRNQRRAYCQQLRQQTQSFLMMSAAERSLLAEQLHRDLKTYITQLKAETQQLLIRYSQQRQLAAEQLQTELEMFIKQLQEAVQTELQELELIRQARQQDVQLLLKHSQAQRLATAQTLKLELAQFMSNLKASRMNLAEQVWGEKATANQYQPVTTKTPPVEVKIPLTKTLVAAQPILPDLESKVYYHLQKQPGLRLVELETLTGINRVQTVDALRSLLQQGKIIQRDRLYFPQ